MAKGLLMTMVPNNLLKKAAAWVFTGLLLSGCMGRPSLSSEKVRTGRQSAVAGSNKCPTPVAGETVDRYGCPVPHGDGVWAVIFASGSTELTADNKFVLNAVVSILKRTGRKTDAIEGYSDLCEGEAVSRRLAQTRIERVVSYLLAQGVRPEQLGTRINYGNSKPFEDTGMQRPGCESMRNNPVNITIIPRVVER